ncbi:hypothetical protein BH10BAC5_BH10BAC5_01610 [soil metagenome]
MNKPKKVALAKHRKTKAKVKAKKAESLKNKKK